MESKVQKWGNSLAIRIPKVFAAEAGLTVNSEVDVALVDGVVIVKQKPKSRFDLKTLVDQITPDNIHAEIETGSEIGFEIQ